LKREGELLLRQELACTKGDSSIDVTAIFLWERKKALADTEASASAPAESARLHSATLLLNASKRNAEELR